MKLSTEEIAQTNTKKQDMKELQSWNHFIKVMKAKGALISHGHGQTKIKI